jgi:hypothetical protein
METVDLSDRKITKVQAGGLSAEVGRSNCVAINVIGVEQMACVPWLQFDFRDGTCIRMAADGCLIFHDPELIAK